LIEPEEEPINPDGRGMTFKKFTANYIEKMGDWMKCKVCNIKMTKFSVKKHLKRSHATSMPFYCEFCPEGFQRPDYRTEHMKSLHPDQLNCSTCDMQFHHTSNYCDHMLLSHNVSTNLEAHKDKREVDVPLEKLRFVPERVDNDVSFS